MLLADERDPEPEKGTSIEARRKYQEFFDRAMISVSEEPVEAGPNGWKSRSPVVRFQPPIDPKIARGLIKHNEPPGTKTLPQVFGYVASDFEILSHFGDEKARGIARVKADEKVEVVFVIKEAVKNEFGDFHWCLVRKATGEEGYIPDRLLRSPVKRERASWSTLPLPSKMQVHVGSSLTMRDSPSIDGAALTSLYDGAKVLVTRWASDEETHEGMSGRWAFVKTDYGLEGYVFAAYLRPEADAPDETPETFAAGDTKYVRSPVLRVRDEPSAYGVSVAAFPSGTEVRILALSTDKMTVVGITAPWVKVRSGDEEGWAFGGFLSARKGATISYDNIYRPFIHPAGDFRHVSSKYGPRVHPVLKVVAVHTGIDIAAPEGAPIRAPADGVVYSVTKSSAYGYLTIVEHSGDLFTWFAHQRALATSSGFRVASGQRIKTGDVIGEVGKTGRVTGAHLHFEVRKGSGQHMDPAIFIPN